MVALKTYIKDNAFTTLLFNGLFVFFTSYLLNKIDFFEGDIIHKTLKLLIFIPMIIVVGFYPFLLIKNLILVLLDYKKQELVTTTLNLKGAYYKESLNGYYGAYFKAFFSNSNKEFWMYNKNQIYFDAVPHETYKIVYYKYSRCIKSIERMTFNTKDIKKKSKEKTIIKRPNKIESFKIFIDNYVDGFMVQLLLLFTFPFSLIFLNDFYQKCLSNGIFDMYYLTIVTFVISYALLIRAVMKKILFFVFYKKNRTEIKKLSVIGLPRTKRFLFKNKPYEYFLKTIDSDGKKITIRFYSTDILSLKVSSERPGYMGYGNFIGTMYEVEYYKLSHIVKSMKLISQPKQSVISDGSVYYDETS